MNNQLTQIVINSCPIIAMFPIDYEKQRFGVNRYAIVFEREAEGRLFGAYGTATWQVGRPAWDNGHYGLDLIEAINDAIKRAHFKGEVS